MNSQINDENLEVAPQEALEKFNNNAAIFVDVREPAEWQSGCVPNAIRLPLSVLASGSAENTAAYGALDAIDAPVVVYCHGGVRSLSGAMFLRNLLQRNDVYSMNGGIMAWAGELEQR